MPNTHLSPDASQTDRWHALRLNVEACYERTALSRPDHHAERIGQLLLTTQHAVIPSHDALQDDSRIDTMLDWYRNLPNDTSPPTPAPIIWYLNPIPPPAQLSVRLLARGVSSNWQPHWMWFELDKLSADDVPPPTVPVEIRPVKAGDPPLTPARDEDASIAQAAEAEPRMVWNIVALLDGKRVGGVTVNITTGEYGVAGLFDTWVDESHQRQGIGAALVRASMRLAKDLGHHHMYLNSTPAGEKTYLKCGFQSIDNGTTWHIRSGFQDTKPPSKPMAQLLEALLQGQLEKLGELGAKVTLEELQNPTTNTATPMEMVTQMKQPASAEWLLQQGVVPDVLSIWDLGWQDKVLKLLSEHPEVVNRKYGDCNETPLHAAAARDDLELAKVLLAAPNIDLTITDDVYHGTPLRWAMVLGAEKVLPLLKSREGSE